MYRSLRYIIVSRADIKYKMKGLVVDLGELAVQFQYSPRSNCVGLAISCCAVTVEVIPQ
jgi:hypothetical protein